MTSQGTGERSKTSEVEVSPIQSHSDGTSGDHTPSCEEIRLVHMRFVSNAAAYQAMSLMIGCKLNANSMVGRRKKTNGPILEGLRR